MNPRIGKVHQVIRPIFRWDRTSLRLEASLGSNFPNWQDAIMKRLLLPTCAALLLTMSAVGCCHRSCYDPSVACNCGTWQPLPGGWSDCCQCSHPWSPGPCCGPPMMGCGCGAAPQPCCEPMVQPGCGCGQMPCAGPVYP